MWIVTAYGFFSVVEKPEDAGTPFLTVRARVRKDLASLLDGIAKKDRPKIDRVDRADYLFRVRLPRDVVADLIAASIRDIAYPNFKDEVKRLHGAGRASIYQRVWAALFSLQGRPRLEPGTFDYRI